MAKACFPGKSRGGSMPSKPVKSVSAPSKGGKVGQGVRKSYSAPIKPQGGK